MHRDAHVYTGVTTHCTEGIFRTMTAESVRNIDSDGDAGEEGRQGRVAREVFRHDQREARVDRNHHPSGGPVGLVVQLVVHLPTKNEMRHNSSRQAGPGDDDI